VNWPVNGVGPGEKVLERENSGERKGADRLPCSSPPPFLAFSSLLSCPIGH